MVFALLLFTMLPTASAKDLTIENATSSLLTVNGTSGFIGIGTPNATSDVLALNVME